MSYIRLQEGPSGKVTVVPVDSVDFAVRDGADVTAYMKSGRTLTLHGVHGGGFIDALCDALDASAPPKGGE